MHLRSSIIKYNYNTKIAARLIFHCSTSNNSPSRKNQPDVEPCDVILMGLRQLSSPKSLGLVALLVELMEG